MYPLNMLKIFYFVLFLQSSSSTTPNTTLEKTQTFVIEESITTLNQIKIDKNFGGFENLLYDK